MTSSRLALADVITDYLQNEYPNYKFEQLNIGNNSTDEQTFIINVTNEIKDNFQFRVDISTQLTDQNEINNVYVTFINCKDLHFIEFIKPTNNKSFRAIVEFRGYQKKEIIK